MWRRLRKALIELDPVRVENRVELGTPDVNLAEGTWIELKWLRKPPARGGIVQVDHYSPQQRVWAIRRIRAGGKVFLLLKISNMWLLFKGDIAAKFLGYSTLKQLQEVAIKIWQQQLNNQEIKDILLMDWNSLPGKF